MSILPRHEAAGASGAVARHAARRRSLTVFDVAIAGGGPAGSAAAIVLAQSGRRVLLADAAAPVGAFPLGEGLPPAARSLLSDLGILRRFLADGHRASFGNVSLWGSDEPRATDFIHHIHGCGHQLDRRRFDALLRARAAELGVEVHEDTRLSLTAPVDAEGAPLRFRLERGGGVAMGTCRAIVDASARSAGIARRLGARRLRMDRLLSFSLLMRPRVGGDRDGRTFVEARASGWWYSALLPCGDRLVSCLSDPDLVDRKRLLDARGFLTELAACRWLVSACRLDDYEPRTAPRAADASSGRLDAVAGSRWLAVGDAALSCDPMLSQGIANAMYTGLAAGRALHAALAGDAAAIAGYRDRLDAMWTACASHRARAYALEQRWAAEPFWRRRAAGAPSMPPASAQAWA